MLNFKNFLSGFHLLKENFEFDNSDIYTKLIFDSLKEKINNQMFINSCNAILEDTSKETWSKAYGFKGRPAVKDWLDAFIPKIVEKSRHKECKITGAILVEHYFDYPDHYLEFLNKQKGGEFKKLEGESKNNSQAYLDQLKTSIIKKI